MRSRLVTQGASVSLQIVVTPSTVGSIVNTASVSSTTADPDGSDNAIFGHDDRAGMITAGPKVVRVQDFGSSDQGDRRA